MDMGHHARRELREQGGGQAQRAHPMGFGHVMAEAEFRHIAADRKASPRTRQVDGRDRRIEQSNTQNFIQGIAHRDIDRVEAGRAVEPQH